MVAVATPGKVKTMRTENGSSVQREVEPFVPQRCPADAQWLKDVLQANGLKAYKPSISVTDPKQRRPANEVRDYCSGDNFKLWSVNERRYVPVLEAPATRDRPPARLQSIATVGPWGPDPLP